MGPRDEHDRIIRLVDRGGAGTQGGTHAGDGILASFDDVANALECSLAIQRGFEARMSDATSRELRRTDSGSPPASPSTTMATCSDRR